MSKEVVAQVKLQLTAKQASPAPPVGSALGQHNVNLMEFVRQFNEKTARMEDGLVVPVVVTIYKDRTFTMELKTPPTSFLLKRAAGIAKGSSVPNREKVGRVTMKQIEEIAKIKMPDLNTDDLEAAKKIVLGTARNMGLEVVSE